MKKTVRITASLLIALSMVLGTPLALAATTTSPSSGASIGSPTATPPSKPTVTKKTLAERIEEYKTKQALKLTLAQQTVLKAKCKAGQVITKALAIKITTNDKARVKAYEEVTKVLADIIPRLKDADVDVTELTAQQTKLAELITTYNADVTTYKTSLSDMNELDCVADPVAYKAALETARAARATVAQDAAAIRTYVTETIKPALKDAKTSLTSTKTEGNQ
jgi:hypothetical protein